MTFFDLLMDASPCALCLRLSTCTRAGFCPAAFACRYPHSRAVPAATSLNPPALALIPPTQTGAGIAPAPVVSNKPWENAQSPFPLALVRFSQRVRRKRGNLFAGYIAPGEEFASFHPPALSPAARAAPSRGPAPKPRHRACPWRRGSLSLCPRCSCARRPSAAAPPRIRRAAARSARL